MQKTNAVTRFVETFAEKVEGMHISPMHWITAASAIIVFRMVLESFSGNGLEIYNFYNALLHPPLSFFSTLLSFALLLSFMTKTRIEKTLKVVLIGLPVILVPPIIDFLASGGRGNVRIQYAFSAWPELLQRYFSYFGGSLKLGFTYGFRIQVAVTVLYGALYIYVKTRKKWKAALGALLIYTLLFVYGSLPAIIGALTYLPQLPWTISEIQIIQRFITARSIFATAYPAEKVLDLFGVEMSLIYLPLIVLQMIIVFWRWNTEKCKEFFKHLRYLRLSFHIIALIIGMFLGVKILGAPFDHSLYGVLMVTALVIAVTGMWIFSLTTNDSNDVAIDKISNQNRLLPRGIFTKEEFAVIGNIGLLLTAFGTLIAGYPFFMLGAASVILSYMYSNPPFRLRQYAGIAPFLMAAGTAFMVLMGFLLFASSGTFYNFPMNFLLLLVLVVTLVMNLKDIKDVTGDKPNGIQTLPTVFGLERSKTIIAVLFFVSYLLFPFILHIPQLIPTALVFGLLTIFLIKTKKVHEGLIFGIYSAFLVVVALLVF